MKPTQPNIHFKICVFSATALISVMAALPVAAKSIDPAWIEAVANQHDMTLPAWGPYTKKYIGISHVPAPEAGLRFDLSVFPGFYRRKANVPNVMYESGFHPWEAAPDLSYFCFRHVLEWKDQVYADISYTTLDENSRLIRAECVNNTDLPQNLVLHFMANMTFPSLRPYSPNQPIYPSSVELPTSGVWVDALDYQTLNYSKSRPSDTLIYDGMMRGEVRADAFVNGSGLGRGFGRDAGDTADYEFTLPQSIAEARLLVRFLLNDKNETSLRLSGFVDETVTFTGTGGLQVKELPAGNLPAGPLRLTLVSNGGSAIELDGFAIVEASDINQVRFIDKEWNYRPEIIDGPAPNSLILKYKDTDVYYGLSWNYTPFQVRQFICDELDVFFSRMVHNHVRDVLQGEGDGHFTNIFLRPIPIAPHTRKHIYAIVCNGSRKEVEQRLRSANQSPQAYEAAYEAGRAQLPEYRPAPHGEPFAFSQRLMAATLACNVVYPVYTQRSYIRHYAPGRWWDSLYTWDSGFIGLGLAELDIRRAMECLNAYVTEPGAQSAFIHHGSMVPVQHYLFLDLWNRTQSPELLEFYYPRLKQYYEFFIGRLGSSTMAKFQSGLLSSFDYFYNSGGWDDYPAQKYTHENRLRGRMAPVVNSAQAVRIAKILAMAASELNKEEDIRIYESDIDAISKALQKYSWDDSSGYFGYVQHDEKGEPTGILKHEGRTNYNMGMDGIYPLVAGIGTPEQTKIMLEHLKSPERLWSRIGLSAVDQSAPYFRIDGYWNGTVWMPHQWFFWKTMLDLGEGEFAWQIAQRALNVWKVEVDATYNCMEHFLIETGRGAGWHQFGALSSPVVKWYAAYCWPGTLTTGFDTWITHQQFAEEKDGLEAHLKIFYGQRFSDHFSAVACMNPEFTYTVRWNGKEITSNEIAKGVLDIQIPSRSIEGKLVISKNE